jgi:geranylgeranylglycerol-phosphate geranylgeranyltransferase
MFLSIVKLMRPINVVIAGFSVLIAASLSAHFQITPTLVFAILSASLITGAANIVNDIYDIEIDKINQPQRVLPSGKLSLKNAWSAYFVVNIFALVLLMGHNGFLLFIAIFSILLLYFYSAYFKRTILAGNFVVSLMAGLAFVFGAVAIGDWSVGVVPAIFAFLFHLGREILKDLQDVQGDLSKGAVTFAGHFGKRKSILLINVIFFLLILFLFTPFVLSQFNIYYIYIVTPGVAVILLFISVLLWFKNEPEWLGKISLLLKIDMFIGLSAIYIGAHHDLFPYY